MTTSCTRCGASLRETGDAHDCDAGVLNNAYEMLKRDGVETTVSELASNTDIPPMRVIQWVNHREDLRFGGDGGLILEQQPETEQEEQSNDPIIAMMLTKIHESGQQLGAVQGRLVQLKASAPPHAHVIRKLLSKSFFDIGFYYSGLTPQEKECGTKEELEAVLKWAEELAKL